MDKITNLKDIVVNTEYSMDGTVMEILSEGEAAKQRPINLKILFEESNSVFKITTWEYKMLEVFKEISESHEICELTIKPVQYREELSYRLISIKRTGKFSEKYTHREFSEGSDEAINRIKELIANMDPDYKALVEELILKNPDFFVWKAAHSMHHAFVGGLVYHTLSVCDQAIGIANRYNGIRNTTINYDILVAGSLLHDIGKLKEYNKDGTYAFISSFSSHLVIGVEMINDACDKLGIDKNSMKMVMLKHIILSHHGKKEWGSPVVPAFIEARIVHESDCLDAHMEEMLEGLEFIEEGQSTGIRGIDGNAAITMYKF